MASAIVLPQADADLDEHVDYLIARSVDAAVRFHHAARSTFRELTIYPHAGSPIQPAVTGCEDVRTWAVRGFPNHIIYYRPTADGVEIVRVLHGARRIEPQMFSRQ